MKFNSIVCWLEHLETNLRESMKMSDIIIIKDEVWITDNKNQIYAPVAIGIRQLFVIYLGMLIEPY